LFRDRLRNRVSRLEVELIAGKTLLSTPVWRPTRKPAHFIWIIYLEQ
jgi:hypothetical protein